LAAARLHRPRRAAPVFFVLGGGGEIPVLFDQRSQRRHPDAEKPVSRAVLARAGFKEAPRVRRDRGIGYAF